MPTGDRTPPPYCHHKGTGLAYCRVDRQFHYFGRFGTPESYRAYAAFIAEWLATGKVPPKQEAALTVSALVSSYQKWAGDYYRKDGEQTTQVWIVGRATDRAAALFGNRPVNEFTPTMLKHVQQSFVDDDLARTTVNKFVGVVQGMFRWGVQAELVDPATADRVCSVGGLRKGRTKAREADPREPVQDELVDAIREHVSPTVWAMIELQRHTGMRSGELVQMRWSDIDTSGDVWLYRPGSHKTEHHGCARVIGLGPRCQEVLEPFRRAYAGGELYRPRPVDAPIFSAAEADAIRRHLRHMARRTPLKYGNRPKPESNHKRRLADHYDSATYRRAVERGCIRAGVPIWTPHMIRHAFTTKMRAQGRSPEAVRAFLGHTSVVMSEHYAHLDVAAIVALASDVA